METKGYNPGYYWQTPESTVVINSVEPATDGPVIDDPEAAFNATVRSYAADDARRLALGAEGRALEDATTEEHLAAMRSKLSEK
jgi:hypothetical protein